MSVNVCRRIAFQSLSALRSLENQSNWDTLFFEEVLIAGLKRAFKSPDETVKLWAQIDSTGECADIHLELMTDQGELVQPWLMTLSRDEGLKEYDGVVEIGESQTPFPEGLFRWECDRFDEEAVTKALRHWAASYWPDWSPRFEWGKIASMDYLFTQIFEELKADPPSLFLVTPEEGVDAAVMAYMTSSAFMVVTHDGEGVLVQSTHIDQMGLIARFPHLSSVEVTYESGEEV